MGTTDAKIVFYKAILERMACYGYTVPTSVAEFFNTEPRSTGFDSHFWGLIVAYVSSNLGQDRNQPGRIVQFLTEITFLASPDTVAPYRYLVSEIFNKKNMTGIWVHSKGQEDASYAFALYMFNSGFGCQHQVLLSKTVSALLGQPFDITQDKAKDDLAIALFGPAWHALYMKDGIPDDGFFHHILNERPPIVGIARVYPDFPGFPTSLDI